MSMYSKRSNQAPVKLQRRPPSPPSPQPEPFSQSPIDYDQGSIPQMSIDIPSTDDYYGYPRSLREQSSPSDISCSCCQPQPPPLPSKMSSYSSRSMASGRDSPRNELPPPPPQKDREKRGRLQKEPMKLGRSYTTGRPAAPAKASPYDDWGVPSMASLRVSDSPPPAYPAVSPKNSSNERRVVVAIMGATGSGKSTFLRACGGDVFQSGHTLASETKDPVEWTGSYKGVSLTLVDTPGFGDTNLPDSVILEKITVWLQNNFEKGRKINGIIYLHRITDNRMTHIGVKNIKMFRQLCGNEAMNNAVLCTSFWDTIDTVTGDSRETELRNEYWKNMIGLGATVLRHNNTKESATAVLDKILTQNGVDLEITKEMASGKKLVDTDAGKLITDDVATREKEFFQALRQLRLDYEEALRERDADMRRIIEEEQKRMFDQIKVIEEDKLRLEQKLDDLQSKVDRRSKFSNWAREKTDLVFQKFGIQLNKQEPPGRRLASWN